MTLRPALTILTVALAGLLPAAPSLAQGNRANRGEARRQKAPGPAVALPPSPESPPKTVDVRVTDRGFEPALIVLNKGERVRLVFTRETDKTCGKVLVIDEFLVWDALPLKERFATTFTPGRSGEFPYTCPTREIQGIIKVEDTAAASSRPASTEFVALPGGPPVGMDYLAYDPATSRLWVPAGNTGRIDVLDTRTGKLQSIEDVPTAKRGDRVVGPSAATTGKGMVYVGNRADSSVCAFDAGTLARKGCVTLASSPDGLAYVATTKEVWVTMPRVGSIAVLDARDPGAPKLSGTVKLEGAPEGYAVDAGRGLFYTNLEDKDRTLVLDVRARKVIATWNPGCGEKGPRGLAVDVERRQLFVACTDRVKALNAATDGAVLSELATGEGVDNVDFLAPRRLVYVASGKEARLTVAQAGENGVLRTAWTSITADGCRSVIVDAAGTAYLPDSRAGRIVVVRPAQ